MFDLMNPSDITEEKTAMRVTVKISNPAGYKIGLKFVPFDSTRYHLQTVVMFSDDTIISDYYSIPMEVVAISVIMFNRLKAWHEEDKSISLIQAPLEGVEIEVWHV